MSLKGSLTILLVLELAVIVSQAFTIGRTQETTDLTSELTEAESNYLRVKNDVKKEREDVENNARSQNILPIETTAKTEEIQKNSTKDDYFESTVPSGSTVQSSQPVVTEITAVNSLKDKGELSSKKNENVSGNGTEVNLPDTTVNEDVIQRFTRDAPITDYEVLTTDFTSPSTDDLRTETSFGNTKKEESNTNIHSTDSGTKFDSTAQDTTTTNNDSQGDDKTTVTAQRRMSDITQHDYTDTTGYMKEDFTASESNINYSVGTVPSWKKYTVIERRRPTTTEDITTISETITTERNEMVREESQNRIITLEKGMSVTSDIPSLKSQKTELILVSDKLPSSQATVSSSSIDEVFVTPDLQITTGVFGTETVPTRNFETSRLDVLTSRRAGFLDYSSKPTAEPTTLENKATDVKANKAEKTTVLQQKLEKKASSMASQSQLAEDAINEELMKEEMLNDNLEYTKQNREERFDVKNLKYTVDSQNAPSTEVIQDNEQSNQELVEDKLSVKPINTEKQKNSGLYTVSPNYKAPKKLDVQPPKQFVRDPDDNSWRNESLTSLGIVFKAKNPAKSFTEVLRNKTESEKNALLDRNNTDGTLGLAERLEKIKKMRNTKKKKIDSFGETIYNDYEDSNISAETTTVQKKDESEPTVIPVEIFTKIAPPTSTSANIDISKETIIKETTTPKEIELQKKELQEPTTTKAPKKQFNIESFENSDEEEPDYASISNIDLKKFLPTVKKQARTTTTTPHPLSHFLPDRQPTLQYFPPRLPQKVKVNVNDYDDDFERKVNAFTLRDPVKKLPITYPTEPTYDTERQRHTQYHRAHTLKPMGFTRPKNLDLNKNYISPINVNEPGNIGYAVINQDGNFNRASYIIKHLKDFISEASKDSEEDKNSAYYITELPLRGITTNEYIKDNKVKSNDYDDYETQFRKDVLDKFVENFNQNSERFKVDFPILYNTSVIHSKLPENGKVQASSSAFIKRLYDNQVKAKSGYVPGSYDPNCDKTVELSPEYELHYYVPEQEEREVADPKPVTLPYSRYRLHV